jgi:tRNA pseudouridine32 synthase/23S rRNA pseudouridine746 synthase
MGFSIFGDPVYGTSSCEGARLHLHARAIEIPLYKNKDPLRIEAPLPAHMEAKVASLMDLAVK